MVSWVFLVGVVSLIRCCYFSARDLSREVAMFQGSSLVHCVYAGWCQVGVEHSKEIGDWRRGQPCEGVEVRIEGGGFEQGMGRKEWRNQPFFFSLFPLEKKMMCGCWRGSLWRPTRTGYEMWHGVPVLGCPSAG